jgi:anti-anti-sigma factor
MPPYEVHIVRQGVASIIRITGEFDLTAAQELRERLREVDRATRELVLDLRETTFIDSTGIGVIVQL